MPFDPDLAQLMRDALGDRPGIVEKKMFGGLCWMLNGNMLCGVESTRFMFRVGKDREADALKWPGASPMEWTGRRAGGLVWVAPDEAVDYGLEKMIDFAAEFAGSLPPK